MSGGQTSALIIFTVQLMKKNVAVDVYPQKIEENRIESDVLERNKNCVNIGDFGAVFFYRFLIEN